MIDLTKVIVGTWSVDDVTVPANRRALNEDAVIRLMESIQKIGLQTPITVRVVDDYLHDDGEIAPAFVLVTGRHRLEAYRRLGYANIPVIRRNCTETEARLWEISENLHRADLTKLERDEQVAEWIRLVDGENEVSFQVETKPKGGRPESGVRAASRELGINHVDAHRATKVASIAPEAKKAAVAFGLDDNRSALLAVAKEDTAKVQEIADQKAAPKISGAADLRDTIKQTIREMVPGGKLPEIDRFAIALAAYDALSPEQRGRFHQERPAPAKPRSITLPTATAPVSAVSIAAPKTSESFVPVNFVREDWNPNPARRA